MNEQTLYWIPQSYIPALGANAAYMLKTLALRQRGAKKKLKSQKGNWFCCPLDRKPTKVEYINKDGSSNYQPLSDQVSWLGHSTVFKIVKKLENAAHIKIDREQWNHINGNTLHYQVSTKACKVIKEAQADTTGNLMRYFDPVEAAELGINAALVLNLVYRDFRLKAKQPDERLIFSRSAIAADLGLPRATVNDVFKFLEEKHLSGVDCSGGKAYRLLVPNPSKQGSYGAGRKSVSTLVKTIVEVETVYNPVCPYQQFNLTVNNFVNAEVQRIFTQAYLVFLYFVVLADEERQRIKEARKEAAKLKPKRKKRVRRFELRAKKKTGCAPDDYASWQEWKATVARPKKEKELAKMSNADRRSLLHDSQLVALSS